MPLSRLNGWFAQRRDQRREDEAQRALHAILVQPDLLVRSRTDDAAAVEQAVRDGADLTQPLEFPGQQERITPLQFAVQNDAWWLQRALLTAFSSVQPAPETVTHVATVVVHGRTETDGAKVPVGTTASHRHVQPDGQTVALFAVALRRAQDALLDTPEDAGPRRAIDAWLSAGVDVNAPLNGTTLLQQLAQQDASLSAWPVPMLARMGVNATDARGLGVLHTVWYDDLNGESVDGFLRLVQAGADRYLADDQGNEPLHHLAQGLAEGTVKPLVIKRLLEQAPDLEWLRPNGQGETLVSMVQQAARRVPPVVRAQACLHVMAPIVQAAERAELEAALFEARTPRTVPGQRPAAEGLDQLHLGAFDDAPGPRSRL